MQQQGLTQERMEQLGLARQQQFLIGSNKLTTAAMAGPGVTFD